MSSEPTSDRSLQVLVLAPTGRDGEVLVQALAAAGMVAGACTSMEELCLQMAAEAGAAVVAGETLVSAAQQHQLEQAISRQPEWSDFPLVVMDTPRPGSLPSATFARMASLSHAVVLVRPVHAHTLVSAVRSALRSRMRQYQVRDELSERMRVENVLRESNARKDEFLAMLGHELRNPLAAIRNATELLKIIASDARMRRVQAVLERQSTHTSRLIDGLLEVSRVVRGKIVLERETLDAREIVAIGLHDLSSQVQARGLELVKDLPAEPAWVWADRVRLVQVIDNLVGNAIKFTDAPGSIRVSVDQQGADVVLRVRDTGVGIRQQLLECIFEPFQQETQDTARVAGGLGLGLALAKGLVELHDGSLQAHSAGPGTGAEFEVRLPLTVAPPEPHPSAPTAGVAPRRVLIVEDNVDAGQSLCDLLEVLGHDATVVEAGAEALDVLHHRGADLVLCDLGLPRMSGYDVARAVRQEASLCAIPLVAVTGYGQPEDRKRTADAGFDDHLTKPVDLRALNAVLSRLGAGRVDG